MSESQLKILSVDVGTENLSYVQAVVEREITGEWKLITVIKDVRKDIKKFENCGGPGICPLKFHDKNFTDYLQHLFHYDKVFEESNIILVERQPQIKGLVAIQELILREYRDKTFLQHPTSVHTRFKNTQKHEKDPEVRRALRKLKAVKETEELMSIHLNQSISDEPDGRLHDKADAFLQLWNFLETENERIFMMKNSKSKYFHSA